MKLETNMYVRTIDGVITKLIGQTERYDIFGETKYCYQFEDNIDVWSDILEIEYAEDVIIKASFNILELLEAGDYVNGRKVYQVGYNFQDEYVLKMSESNYEDFIYPNEIKSIVTKEQFEAIKYEIK